MVSTITDVRVPADAFPLGQILQEYPDIEIELVRIVPTDQGVIPLFWITSDRESEIKATLRADPLVERLDELTRMPDRVLLSVNWSPDIDALVGTLIDLGVVILSAEGTANFWEFRLQFADRDQLSAFRRQCATHDVPVELLRVYNPTLPTDQGPLTPEQREALELAYEHGFWDIPRGVTQTELATLAGISDNSMSQRLRRGIRVAVSELLYGTTTDSPSGDSEGE
ncbi:helix-turn-helix domain-containing protein [Halomicroarcula sp. GCM10025709]|uniref:helix-turn-helix domain-containing protein n=1 Tax=Haloarcula TaxID=2237 RepID=UPI0024C292F9|nr:helix-turn-helix domain-containing protein [Halomicroarcula sp. YJ-61-S]